MDENGVKRYDKQVLGCLLDKYENSLLHMEKNQVQIRIVYPVKKSTLPESFDFLLWLRTRLSEGESIRKYVAMDQAEEFAGLCELVWRILNNRQECFLRQFFICWFHDSKQADTGFDAGRSFFLRVREDCLA